MSKSSQSIQFLDTINTLKLLMFLALSGHPFLPYMVSSGLETSGKMWMPSGEHRPLAEEDSDQCKEADVSTTVQLDRAIPWQAPARNVIIRSYVRNSVTPLVKYAHFEIVGSPHAMYLHSPPDTSTLIDSDRASQEILLKNSHRRSRGEPARENMMPPADFMSWMSAQFGGKAQPF